MRTRFALATRAWPLLVATSLSGVAEGLIDQMTRRKVAAEQ